MTFLENLAPLVNAAEKYANLTQMCETHSTVETIVNQSDAARELLAAAIEFAKWGKNQ